jgi:hypothetical protein
LKLLRRLAWIFGTLLVATAVFVAWVMWPSAPKTSAALTIEEPSSAAPETTPTYIPSIDPPASPTLVAASEDCDGGDAPASAPSVNAASLTTIAWSPFGRPETGWEIYAPRIAAEIGTRCAPSSRRFAAALAQWQRAHRLPPSGVMDPATFQPMVTGWHLARPFVRINGKGICPDAPPVSSLATARPNESYGGKVIQLRPGALEAYRDMVAEARAAGVVSRPEVLTIFSGFRDPNADAARCARDNNCQGLVRTICSAHRTGLAMDVYIAAAPGFGPDSSSDDNRRAMARSPVFQWMVVHAGRFGFVNYPFEPWHWEWTGEPLLSGVPISSLPQAGSQPAPPVPAKP